MFNKVRKYVLPSLAAGLFISPVLLYGQDLGSSNGLFRNPKTAAKSSNEKRRLPVKKNTLQAKTPKENTASAIKKKATSNPSNSNLNIKETAAKPSKTKSNNSIEEKLTIFIGGKTSFENSETLFEQLVEKGNTARDERNYTLAETSYLKAKSLKPNDWRAAYGLGNLFSDQQRWEEAEKFYRLAIQLDPDSPETNVALSFVLTQPISAPDLMARYAEAEKNARKAIELDATNAAAYDQLGASLESRGLIDDETKNAYQKAVELDSTFALAYAHFGRLLRRKGLETESNSAYEKAIQTAEDVPTMILVAEVMQSQQRYVESEQLLRKALQNDPKNPSALFFLGRSLITKGEFVEAEKLLKKRVGINPNSFVSHTALSSLYVRQNNFAEAENALMQALKVVSESEKKRLAQEFEAVGDGYMRTGKNKDAARIYKQAIKLDKEREFLADKIVKAEKTGNN